MMTVAPSESSVHSSSHRTLRDGEPPVAPIESRPATVEPCLSAASSRFVTAGLAVLAGLVAGTGLLAVVAAGFALSFDAIGSVGKADAGAVKAHVVDGMGRKVWCRFMGFLVIPD